MKLIVVTPAGREKYLRLLSHHVLKSAEVAEWHLWDNCRDANDQDYLHRLAASDPRCQLKQLPDAKGGWGIIGDFFQFCDDPEALYLRLDDDIVFIEEGFFTRYIERAQAVRGKALWFSPLVINNALCSILIKYLSKVTIEGPITCQAMCPFSWKYANLPAALHPVFQDAARQDRLDDFRVPDREVRMSRFSINALGFFGSDKLELGDQFCPIGNGMEEEWLSAVLPALLDRSGLILGDLIVAHFSYYPQEEELLQTDALKGYYDLAGLDYPGWPAPRHSLKDRLRPWKRRRKDPGPTYRVALGEA